MNADTVKLILRILDDRRQDLIRLKQTFGTVETVNGTTGIAPSAIAGRIRLFWDVTDNEWAYALFTLSAKEAGGLADALVKLSDGTLPDAEVHNTYKGTRQIHGFSCGSPTATHGYALRLDGDDHVFMAENSYWNIAVHVAGLDNAASWFDAEKRKDDGLEAMWLEHLDEAACKMTPDQAGRIAALIEKECS